MSAMAAASERTRTSQPPCGVNPLHARTTSSSSAIHQPRHRDFQFERRRAGPAGRFRHYVHQAAVTDVELS